MLFKQSFSSFSTNDLDKTVQFYASVLGLKVNRTNEGLNVKTHSGEVFIYPKPNHVPATFTVLNFQVEDIETAVDELTAQGVRFEQYGGEIQNDAKGIFRGEGPTIAWFTDPGGNILSLIERKG